MTAPEPFASASDPEPDVRTAADGPAEPSDTLHIGNLPLWIAAEDVRKALQPLGGTIKRVIVGLSRP